MKIASVLLIFLAGSVWTLPRDHPTVTTAKPKVILPLNNMLIQRPPPPSDLRLNEVNNVKNAKTREVLRKILVNVDKARENFTDDQKAWIKLMGLTDDEVRTVMAYTDSNNTYYADYNAATRNNDEEFRENYLVFFYNMLNAIGKITVRQKFNGQVYRGTSLKFAVANKDNNNVINFKQFMSTSSNRSIADYYCKQGGSKGSLFTINVNYQQVFAADISLISMVPGESEILLAPDQNAYISNCNLFIHDCPVD